MGFSCSNDNHNMRTNGQGTTRSDETESVRDCALLDSRPWLLWRGSIRLPVIGADFPTKPPTSPPSRSAATLT